MMRLPGWKPPVISSRSLKPGRRAGERGALDRQPVQLVELVVQDLLDRAEVLLPVVVGDLEHRALGLLDELARGGAALGDGRLDLVRRVQHPAQQRVLADDPRVLAHVAGRGNAGGQLVDRAGRLGVAVGLEALRDGQDVDRLALAVQAEHRRVDHGVALAVEVLGLEPLLDDERVHRALRQQDRAEDRGLGLQRVRRAAAVGRRDGRCEGGAHGAINLRAPGAGLRQSFPLAADLPSRTLARTHVRTRGGRRAKASPLLRSLCRAATQRRPGVTSPVRFGDSGDAAVASPGDAAPTDGEAVGGHLRSTTIVLTVAFTPSATSTTTM